MGAALIAGFQQHESGMIHHKAIWFFMPVSVLALTVSEFVSEDCCQPANADQPCVVVEEFQQLMV